MCPKGVADRVNLGLIPSSEEGWPTACGALKPHTGGTLHIHGNVTSHPHSQWNTPSGESDLETMQSTHAEGDTVDSIQGRLTSNPCEGNVTSHPHSQWNTPSGESDLETMQSTHAEGDTVDIQGRLTSNPCVKWKSPSGVKQKEWCDWSMHAANQIQGILVEIHRVNWEVEIEHLEHVKSYAPHVDHLVLDLACRPAR